MDNSQAPRQTFSELTLRRYRAGELSAAQRLEIENATTRDNDLRLRLKALADEQNHFELTMPFERFVGGVGRAQRDLAKARFSMKTPLWAATAAMAAAAAVVLVFAPAGVKQNPGNRTKGGDSPFTAYVRVASENGEQRVASPRKLTSLRPGDRVRVGVQLANGTAYFAAISVEAAGATTAIYPEGNTALKLVPTQEPMYMPDSVQFTGQGEETLFVLAAPQPFDVATATQALKAASGQEAQMNNKIPGLTVIPYPLHKP